MFGFFFVQALMEETHLESEFGETYNHYRESVPRWIPKLTPYKGKSEEVIKH
jgi:protein-S-isoprenylcysteine O-methyltransferase Ste14